MGSTITPGQVDAIAHSIDIPKLAPAAAKALAPDVEYRLRELIQVRAAQALAASQAALQLSWAPAERPFTTCVPTGRSQVCAALEARQAHHRGRQQRAADAQRGGARAEPDRGAIVLLPSPAEHAHRGASARACSRSMASAARTQPSTSRRPALQTSTAWRTPTWPSTRSARPADCAAHFSSAHCSHHLGTDSSRVTLCTARS